MQASAELNNLYLRLLEAYNTADDRFVEEYTDRQNGMLFIGTDPSEWWDNHETFMDGMRAALKEFQIAGVSVAPTNPQIFVEGSIGWLADRPVFTMPDGTTLESRMTAVFRQHDGGWKFVQQHMSFAIRNDEVVDMDEQALIREATA